MNKLLKANQHGIFINTKAIMLTDFNVTPNQALEWMLEIVDCDAKPKQKIDALLKIDSIMFCNLGIETPKKERQEVKAVSKKIYRAIAKIDKTEGELLLATED